MQKCLLYLFCKEVAELDTLDGEVDNGRVLLHKEGVLREPLDVQDDEPNTEQKINRDHKEGVLREPLDVQDDQPNTEQKINRNNKEGFLRE
jgi:hypothetical protein